MHVKLDSLENAEVRLRGQTAGIGIRLNPKLASLSGRSGIVSQSNMTRKPFKAADSTG